MSLQLKVFGGLSLIDSTSGVARVTRRHRLAVLAVLAAADRPVPRERLLALLWPDSHEEAARHALGQLLYGLRQDVALGDLVTGATDLTLDRSKIACDLWCFRDAVRSGDRRLAVETYTGLFLDGIQLPNADSFDRWCDEERRALARQVNDLTEWLANDSVARGDVNDAVNWWRRLIHAEPLSSRWALNYMRALAAAGDRTTAVQHARVHAALVRAELDTDADPSVQAYANELRSADVKTVLVPTIAAPLADTPSATAAVVATPLLQPTAIQTAAAPGDVNVARAPRALPFRLIIIASLAFVAIAIWPIWERRHSLVVMPDISAVPTAAVLPFDVRGDSAHAFLGEALSTLLASRLDAPGVLRTLESNAVLTALTDNGHRNGTISATQLASVVQLGATVIASGTIVIVGDRLEISAELRGQNEPTNRVARATVTGPSDSLFALADKLGSALLIAREGRTLGKSALGGTQSVRALKALLAGERALRRWQLFDAISAYESALAIDSTYAFAWFRVGFARGWAGVGGADEALANARRFAAELPERYALLAAATEERARNDPRAERDLFTLVQRYPDDADAWSELGEYRMHVGPMYGEPTTNAGAPLARVLALDSIGHPEVRWHLSQLAFERGDVAGARAIIAPLLRDRAGTDRIVRGLELAIALSSDATSQVNRANIGLFVRSLRLEPASSVGTGLGITLSSIGATDAAYALAESLATGASSRAHQAIALNLLMQMDVTRRQWDDMRHHASLLAAVDSVALLEAWAIVAQAPDVPLASTEWRNASRAMRPACTTKSRSGAPSALNKQRAVNVAVVSIRATDNDTYVQCMSYLTGASDASALDSITVRTVRALHAQIAHDTTAESREVRDMAGPLEWQLSRWVRGAWLERVGRADDAERWFLSSTWGPLAVVLTRPALEHASTLAAVRGDTIAARDFARRAVLFGHAAGAR